MSGMFYLFFQIWIWIALSFAIGMLVHRYFFCPKRDCNCDDKADETSKTQTTPQAVTVSSAPVVNATEKKEPPKISDDWKPALFSSAPEVSDDLKRIKGIGAVIEKTLNELGVYQFEQISQWSNENCAWVDNFLSFPGRIDRENWVDQATLLAKGGTTEFSKRVDKGDVNYK